MARCSARLLRGKTPNLREEPQVYYVVDKHMCFVCYRLADMPTPEWRRVCGYALVVARRFGYQRNRLPHRPKSVLAAWISTVYPSAKSPRDRQCIVAEGSGSNKNFARDTELPSFPLGPGSVRFYLRKRTLTPTVGMSALCQKRTSV
jgi:hypothetical protein